MTKLYRIIRINPQADITQRVIGIYTDEELCDIHLHMAQGFNPTYTAIWGVKVEYKKEVYHTYV